MQHHAIRNNLDGYGLGCVCFVSDHSSFVVFGLKRNKRAMVKADASKLNFTNSQSVIHVFPSDPSKNRHYRTTE